jgi:hypothetical protein
VGSTTQNLRIFNPVQDDIIIEAIELVGGDDSDFILNVNGTAGSMIRDVAVRGNDSLFVFVGVNVNSSDDNSPFVVSDSILCYTRDRIQAVQLVAYGQNVVLLREQTLKTQTFTNDKPYLIYDWAVVDSAETLTIEPGARLHFHKDASLIVFGSIQVKGALDHPVLFASDRLEEWYQDKPGQWGDIHLMPGSRNHIFSNAIIRNSTRGLVVDLVGVGDDEPPLYLDNVRIEHISSQGLITQNSSVVASNSVFANTGSASVALTGGNYKFYHCTIANYFTWLYRSTAALQISNYFIDVNGKSEFASLDAAEFYNCIVYGRNDNEIELDFIDDPDEEGVQLSINNVKFSHSLVKRGQGRNSSYSSAFGDNDVESNDDPVFVDPYKFDYQLDSLSVARDAGSRDVARDFPDDILGNNRLDDNAPDLGAFERIDKQ